MKGFYRQEECGTKKLKSRLFQARLPFFRGKGSGLRQTTSVVLVRKFQTDWF